MCVCVCVRVFVCAYVHVSVPDGSRAVGAAAMHAVRMLRLLGAVRHVHDVSGRVPGAQLQHRGGGHQRPATDAAQRGGQESRGRHPHLRWPGGVGPQRPGQRPLLHGLLQPHTGPANRHRGLVLLILRQRPEQRA